MPQHRCRLQSAADAFTSEFSIDIQNPFKAFNSNKVGGYFDTGPQIGYLNVRELDGVKWTTVYTPDVELLEE